MGFLLEADVPSDDHPDGLREHLQKKSDLSRSLLERIVVAVQEIQSRNDSLTNLLANEGNTIAATV
jgi:hypothetical protein